LILVTFVVFWQVHSYEFVLWDDGLHVFENPYFQSLTSPFALSTFYILNFKLPVERSPQPQPLQDVLLHP